MKISCLSGKGGAGKTLVAVNLAHAAGKAVYIDCDVEEPNGRLFWKPENVRAATVYTLLPSFDPERCSGCRKCVEFCRFHGLIFLHGTPKVFPEVCHSCGGCRMVCPEGAVTEIQKRIGTVEIGTRGETRVVTGVLDPGEATGVPVIRQALKQAEGLTVIDCPPGSACSVMESVTEADYCLLVAEPTAFGFHNFRMVHELVSLLGKPCGVIINKQNGPFAALEQFCDSRGIPVLARIPYDPVIASKTANGEILSEDSSWRAFFCGLLDQIGGAV